MACPAKAPIGVGSSARQLRDSGLSTGSPLNKAARSEKRAKESRGQLGKAEARGLNGVRTGEIPKLPARWDGLLLSLRGDRRRAKLALTSALQRLTRLFAALTGF